VSTQKGRSPEALKVVFGLRPFGLSNEKAAQSLAKCGIHLVYQVDTVVLDVLKWQLACLHLVWEQIS
jgi:hypothetical protein